MTAFATAEIRFRVNPGDVPPVKAARRLHLTLERFNELLPNLIKRGFPEADPDTGMYDLEAIDLWRRNRHKPATELTEPSEAPQLVRMPHRLWRIASLQQKNGRPRGGGGTVALPDYVRPVHKPNGRTYYYFEKFRRTPRAWPRVRM